MQSAGDAMDVGAGSAATALAPLQHAAGELDGQPSHSYYAEDSYAEPFEEDSTFIQHPAAESSDQQLLQQEPTHAIHPAAGLHQAVLEQLQHASSNTRHQQQHQSRSIQSLQQQEEQVLLEGEQQLHRSAGSSPASPHLLRQQQQLLELQQQWAEQEHDRLQRIADSLHGSPVASQQQQGWQQQQQQHGWEQQQQDWQQQQQQHGLGPAGATGFADAAAASSGDGGDELTAGDAAAAVGELGSPSSVFLPAGSLTSSLQFAHPPLHASSPTAAAALRGSDILRQGMVRSSSPPLSPTPAAAAAAVAAAAPAAARQLLSALQLRCQALEVSLEQQAQQAQAAAAALASAHAAHSVEQESMRQYYEVRHMRGGGSEVVGGLHALYDLLQLELACGMHTQWHLLLQLLGALFVALGFGMLHIASACISYISTLHSWLPACNTTTHLVHCRRSCQTGRPSCSC
jgi:hypothetical protein